MLKGIDISKWQSSVSVDSFRKAKEAGFEFVYIKGGEGYSGDKEFAGNWERAREAGMIAGAYHFARPDTHSSDHIVDARKEAQGFCERMRTANGDAPMLPPALDYEKYFSGLDMSEKRGWVLAFVEAVRHGVGRSPAIYTGSNVWHYQLGDWSPDGCPLWLVRYAAGGTNPTPDIAPHKATKFPMPWNKWTFWQWSGGGKYKHHGPVPGFANAVDVNWFNGDMNDLRELAGMFCEDEPSACDADAEATAACLRELARKHDSIASNLRTQAFDLECVAADA